MPVGLRGADGLSNVAGMTTYAALLRGVNVGGHRKLPMGELRALMAGLGWSEPRTYLQSGNAVFTTDDADPRARLEAAIEERFGFAVPCLLRTAGELRQAVADCPFPVEGLDPAKLVVFFLDGDVPAEHFASLDPAAYAPERWGRAGAQLYAYFPDGMGRAKLPAALAAVRPQAVMTARNWRTVQRLIELAG